jgi:mannose-1-phosphate guanylyltransferase/mannose-6-phosphate isomerase
LGIVPAEKIRILTGKHLLEPVRRALHDLEVTGFMVEPQAKGTAPVLAWAAWTLLREDPETVLVSLHADHAIEPPGAFQTLIRNASALARRERRLFTVAVPPTRPETGYGYIRPGDPLAEVPEGLESFRVRSFVEKPGVETARRYLEEGFLWNSGIFLWRADVFLEEVRSVAPELARLIPHLEAGDAEAFFREAPTISVDEAILERSSRVASVRATFSWDDVGSWEALCRTRPADEAGNVAVGDTHLVEARNNIVVAEEGRTVLFGVEGLVVVRSRDIVLVADRSKAPQLKSLLSQLPRDLRNPEPE